MGTPSALNGRLGGLVGCQMSVPSCAVGERRNPIRSVLDDREA